MVVICDAVRWSAVLMTGRWSCTLYLLLYIWWLPTGTLLIVDHHIIVLLILSMVRWALLRCCRYCGDWFICDRCIVVAAYCRYSWFVTLSRAAWFCIYCGDHFVAVRCHTVIRYDIVPCGTGVAVNFAIYCGIRWLIWYRWYDCCHLFDLRYTVCGLEVFLTWTILVLIPVTRWQILLRCIG